MTKCGNQEIAENSPSGGTGGFPGLPGTRARVTRARQPCNTEYPHVPPEAAENRVSWFLRPDQPAWVREGVLAWLESGDPLHLCLDLDRVAHSRARRDYHLVRAWLALAGPSGWPRALLLSAEIRKFSSRVWPRLRDLAEPDPAWSVLRRELWLAFHASNGCKFPQTPERIKEIVNSAGVYNSLALAENRSSEFYKDVGYARYRK